MSSIASQVAIADSQKTNGKHENEMNLLPESQVELEQLWHWKDDNPYIKDDIDNGMRPGEGVQVHAMSFGLASPASPGVGYRNAVHRDT